MIERRCGIMKACNIFKCRLYTVQASAPYRRVDSTVLCIPGDGRSGTVLRAVVHFMEAVSKSVEMPLAFASYWRLSLSLSESK